MKCAILDAYCICGSLIAMCSAHEACAALIAVCSASDPSSTSGVSARPPGLGPAVARRSASDLAVCQRCSEEHIHSIPHIPSCLNRRRPAQRLTQPPMPNTAGAQIVTVETPIQSWEKAEDFTDGSQSRAPYDHMPSRQRNHTFHDWVSAAITSKYFLLLAASRRGLASGLA